MSLYFARYKNMHPFKKGLYAGGQYFIEVRQSIILNSIHVLVEGIGGWMIYKNLDLFLDDWDDLERQATDKDTVAGLVGV